MSRKIPNPEAGIKQASGIEQIAGIHQDRSHVAPGSAKTIFPIAGIGASAGGLNGYSKLPKAMPQELGSAKEGEIV